MRRLGWVMLSAILAVGSAVFIVQKIKETDIARRCPPLQFESNAPFQIGWVAEGAERRYELEVKSAQPRSYLFVRQMTPSFEGLTPPFVIRSDDGRRYRTAWSPGGRLRISSQYSYAWLPDDLQDGEAYEVRFPVEAEDPHISQAAGSSAGKVTHLPIKGMRNAVDIVGRVGERVVAARDGTVVFVENRSPDGACTDPTLHDRDDNQIVIVHDDGTEAVYGHLQQGSVRVVVGQRVRAGEHIAAVGKSGWTPGSHLHFHVGGLRNDGYRTLPVLFKCADGRRIVPQVRGPVC